MNTGVKLCDECKTFLENKSKSLFLGWESICNTTIETSTVFFAIKESINPAVIPLMIELERHGFIKTADALPFPIMHVNGLEAFHDEDSGYFTFCINREEHKNAWA